MPLIRKELKTDPVMAQLAAYSVAEFRSFVVVGFVAVLLGASLTMLFAHGIAAWAAAMVCVSVAAFGFYKLRQERALLDDCATAVATVSAWNRTEVEAGYVYSVSYRFLGPDGKVYLGKSGSSSKVLPREGETIPVAYRRSDPAQNMTLATLWFYQFTYTGTE
jgi:hypothetical protein